jgi:VanZ family protein
MPALQLVAVSYQRSVAVATIQSIARMLNLLIRIAKNPRAWQLALACYWIALFIGTHVPIDRIPIVQGSTDKLAHIVAFAGLTGIFAITWRLTIGRLTLTHAVWIWLIVVVYGVLEELTQPFAGRVASAWDLLADSSGALIGLTVYSVLPQSWFNDATTIKSEAAVPPSRNWHQFSLRTIFVAMTLIAVACYFLVLPTMHAQRFVRAVANKDYAGAEQLFTAGSDTFPGTFKQHRILKQHVELAPLTWSDFRRGRRSIGVSIQYGDDNGIATCGAAIESNRRGLKVLWWVP